MRDISLTLRPRFESGSADKAISNQQKLLRQNQTVMDRFNKDAARGLKEQESLWKRLEAATSSFARGSLRAMDSALGGINKFQRGLEGAIKGAVSLRNVVMGSAVGYGAYRLGAKVLHAGAGDVRNARMLTREFGPGLLKDLALSGSKYVSKAAGIEDDDALVGLLPIMRAIRETRVGDTFRGSKIRNTRDLEAVQRRQMTMSVERFKQLAVLNPNMSPEQIGFLLAEAGQGEEGMRGLGRALNLGKASMADIMRDAKKKKMGAGDIVSTMFERAGYTDKSVQAEQKSFEFQIKQLGTAVETTFGDIGSRAIEKLNERLGKGASLAERFGSFMERHQETVDKLADGFATMVEKLIDLAEKLPKALSWLDEHKGTLLGIGAAYAGLRVAGSIRETIGKSGLSDVVDKVTGGDGQRVFVTNWPGSLGGGGGLPDLPAGTKAGGAASLLQKAGLVAGAATAGFAIGTAADRLSGGRLSSGLASALDGGANAIDEQIGVDAHRKKLAGASASRLERIALLESRGIEHGAAVQAADSPTSAAGLATMKRAGINFNVPINIGHIGATVGQNAPAIVKMLMPDLQEQLTRALRAMVPGQ